MPETARSHTTHPEATMTVATTLLALLTPMIVGAPPTPHPARPATPVTVADPIGPAAPTWPASASEAGATTTVGTPAGDAARYAAMEKSTSPKVTEFRGGTVVVFVSTGAAILLIVLLILLL